MAISESVVGQLRLGDRPDLDQLTAELGVSQTPVREAVLELSYEGLVAITPRSISVVGISSQDRTFRKLTEDTAIWDRTDKSRFWKLRHGAAFEKIEDGALSFGKAYEFDAGPDDAIRSRSCISHLTRDRHIDGGTELKAQRNATTHIQSELTVLPHTEKFNWVGVAKVYPHAKRRNVDDRALPPQVQWLVLDMATAHPKGRLAFCPSAILHGLSSNRAQRGLAKATHPSTSFDQSPDRLEQHRENRGSPTEGTPDLGGPHA
jgi:Bacterial regulatory proteins, gntR family